MIINLSVSLLQRPSRLYSLETISQKINLFVLKQKLTASSSQKIKGFPFFNDQLKQNNRLSALGKIVLNQAPKVSIKGRMQLGENVLLDSSENRVEISVEENGELHIGSNTKILGAEIFVNHKVVIGDNCTIGSHCILMDDDFEPKSASSIEIEDNVSIGERSVILSGVRIGSGAKILEGSIVTRNIAAGEVFTSNKLKSNLSKKNKKKGIINF